MSSADVAWAAGLFVGEGNVGRMISRNSSGTFEYLCLQIGMYDERAIRRFANVFSVPHHPLFLKARNRIFYKVLIRGRSAEKMIARMWPYIKDTDKGDQAMRYAKRLGVEDWITGARRGVRPQLQNQHRGKAKVS